MLATFYAILAIIAAFALILVSEAVNRLQMKCCPDCGEKLEATDMTCEGRRVYKCSGCGRLVMNDD